MLVWIYNAYIVCVYFKHIIWPLNGAEVSLQVSLHHFESTGLNGSGPKFSPTCPHFEVRVARTWHWIWSLFPLCAHHAQVCNSYHSNIDHVNTAQVVLQFENGADGPHMTCSTFRILSIVSSIAGDEQTVNHGPECVRNMFQVKPGSPWLDLHMK